jgi:hypothetical protein
MQRSDGLVRVHQENWTTPSRGFDGEERRHDRSADTTLAGTDDEHAGAWLERSIPSGSGHEGLE